MAATLDTLALAAEERAKQGIHELEISFGGELDLLKHHNDCVKNPGHRKFIPIKKLRKYHIPENNHRKIILRWIRHVSRYTVKLSVNYVSPNRAPQLPLSNRAGQRVMVVGSGYVAKIPLEGNDRIPCPFANCGKLPGNHEVCGYITVVTAAHVVFDDEEAENTTVEFFYDDPDDRSGVMTARGVKVAASSVEGDFCELLCVTHDTNLVARLNEPLRGNPYSALRISVNNIGRNLINGLGCRYHPNTRLGDVERQFLSVGSECVIIIPSAISYSCVLQYRIKRYCKLPRDHQVRGTIRVVSPSDVFDDEDANNATLGFFHDNPSGTISDIRGVKMGASKEQEDFNKLLQAVETTCDLHRVYNLLDIEDLSGRRICDLLQTLLPGIENIKCKSETFFEFLVEIRLSNLSEALQTLALLQLFTVETVSKLLKMWMDAYDSAHDLLKSISFEIADILHFIDYEISMAKQSEMCRYSDSASFVHLCEKLTDLRRTLLKPDAENPRNHWHDLLSIISELVSFYSTVEKWERSFYFNSVCHRFDILNRQRFVSISNDTATVTVTVLSGLERDAIRGYKATLGLNSTAPDYFALVPDITTQKYPIELKPTDKEFNPDMFLVHIAHPHGQSKQVTIGRQTDCFTGEGFYHQLYTAPTCPGCSGGPVWMIPASGDPSQVYGVPHSGHIGNELNRGCSWTVYPHQLKLEIPSFTGCFT